MGGREGGETGMGRDGKPRGKVAGKTNGEKCPGSARGGRLH